MSDSQASNPPALPRTSGLAVGSLISSLFGLIPFAPSITAVILGHIALVRIKKLKGQLQGKGLAIGGLVLGYLGIALWLMLLLFAAILVPTLLASKLQAYRTIDMSNMKQISVALHMYANDDKQGRLPDDLSILAKKNYYLPPGKEYVCPSTKTPAPKTVAEIKAGRCDYVYVGNGLTLDRISSETVILYDKPGNFKDYINVGLADGSVIGVKAKDIAEACAKNNWILPKPGDH